MTLVPRMRRLSIIQVCPFRDKISTSFQFLAVGVGEHISIVLMQSHTVREFWIVFDRRDCQLEQFYSLLRLGFQIVTGTQPLRLTSNNLKAITWISGKAFKGQTSESPEQKCPRLSIWTKNPSWTCFTFVDLHVKHVHRLSGTLPKSNTW